MNIKPILLISIAFFIAAIGKSQTADSKCPIPASQTFNINKGDNLKVYAISSPSANETCHYKAILTDLPPIMSMMILAV